MTTTRTSTDPSYPLQGEEAWKQDDGFDEEKLINVKVFMAMHPHDPSWQRIYRVIKERIAEKILLGD